MTHGRLGNGRSALRVEGIVFEGRGEGELVRRNQVYIPDILLVLRTLRVLDSDTHSTSLVNHFYSTIYNQLTVLFITFFKHLQWVLLEDACAAPSPMRAATVG